MLGELVERLGGRCGLEGQGPEVRDVQLDSRRVAPGDLFVALRGGVCDGREFIPQALAAGASAILVEEEPPPGSAVLAGDVPLWIHREARAVAGHAAAWVHARPSRELEVFAVTGTNGKTTTAHLVGELLRAVGREPAVLGTAGHRLARGAHFGATHTTPDAPELQRLLARHRAAGGDSVVLEVSSHALVQERTAGLEIDVALYTNLSRDHLDYHGDMQHYAAAKSLMFSSLDSDAVAIINIDDDCASIMADAARQNGATVVTYGGLTERTDAQTDLRASQLEPDSGATYLTLSGMGISQARLRIPLSGRFNVANALAASAAVLMSGASPSAVVEGLASVSPPPGRLEPVELPAGAPRVLVDYAHTPEALRLVLEALRETLEPGARLLCVFGCGGERDRGKRAPMGRAACQGADVAFLTSDNPRAEDPERILADVRAGAAGPGELREEVDRRLAIRAALREGRPGDVLLIAGKGHEARQALAAGTIEFDDRVVAREEWA